MKKYDTCNLAGFIAVIAAALCVFAGCQNPADPGPGESDGTPPAKPTASVSAGTYACVQTVTLSTDAGAEIWYTTDGGEPAAGTGTKYTAPISLNRNCVLKAVAIKSGAPASEVLTVEYTISLPSLSWTTVASNPLTGIGMAVGYGNGTFVAGMAKNLMYSANGIDWINVETQPLSAGNIRGIVYGNGTFVAGGKGETARSTNGINWTKSEDNEFGTSYIYGVAFGNGTFVAVGQAGKMAYSTDNGSTWEPVAVSQFSSSNINGVAWGGGRFIAVGAAGKTAYSTDGVSWTAGPVVQNPFTSTAGEISGICYGNGTFVLTSGGSPGYAAYSADQGAAWTPVTVGRVESANIFNKTPCVVWGGGQLRVCDLERGRL
jgi:hypothetical protein